MCGLTLFSKHLNHHMAVTHLFEKYLKNISSVPGYKTNMINEGLCPVCPWKPNQEKVAGDNVAVHDNWPPCLSARHDILSTIAAP